MTFLSKVVGIGPGLTPGVGGILVVSLVVAGCLGPSATDRPEVELVDSRQGASMRATVKRDGDKVWIEDVRPTGDGNGHVRGLEVLLAHAGTPVAYERLMGLSGMAFITQADTGHRWEGVLDVGWWPLDEWGLSMRLDFLGRAVGRDLKKVTAPTTSPPNPAEAYRAHFEPLVKKSVDEGRPLLTPTEFGFVIFGYDDEPEQPPVLGRCARETTTEMYRMESWPWALFVLGEQTTPMDTDTADVAALQYAVNLAYDRAGPDDPRWRGRRLTGQKAFAAWSAVLRNPDEPVEDRHHANMRGNLHWNRTAAVAYLRDVAGRSDGGAAEALQEAAASYESVLKQLGQINCTGLADDLEARRTLADQIDSIAATEREAAQHLERAVIHMTVQRDSGKVWIEGVEGWSFAQKGSSVHAAMEVVMRTVGEDVPYEYLVGTSALAFRMQVHNEWCPSSPHPWCGYQCVSGSVKALPWKVRAYEVKPDDADGVREARAAVVASIDRGVPCAYGSEEDGVIYGYQKGGEEWLCVHPFRGGNTFVETKWPWGIGVYTERKAEMPDRRALVLASLKQAVEMAHTKNVDEYDCGFHAWEQWIARLRDEKWIAQRSENEAGLMQGNSWIYCCLVEYRGAAAHYLRSVADDFDRGAAEHLCKAADLYERMVKDILLAGDCPLDVAPMAENLKEGERWTQAMRDEQARRLEAALELERQAIAEIEKALATLK